VINLATRAVGFRYPLDFRVYLRSVSFRPQFENALHVHNV
jgi:hypothetical protein